jgi:hypothetical protein
MKLHVLGLGFSPGGIGLERQSGDPQETFSKAASSLHRKTKACMQRNAGLG